MGNVVPNKPGEERSSNRRISNVTKKGFDYVVYQNGVFHSSTPLSPRKVDSVQDFWIGYKLPDFHRRKNAGELLPMTYYVDAHSFTKQSYGEQWIEFTDSYGTLWRSEVVPNEPGSAWLQSFPTSGTPAVPADMFNEVNSAIQEYTNLEKYVQQAAAKLYGRGWDTLTFLAELHHVLRMFKNALRNFLQLLKGRSLHEITQEWLSTRYGWRVLFYDIKDINEVMENIDKDQLTRVKERVGENLSWETSIEEPKEYDFGYAMYTLKHTHSYSFRGSIIADFTPSNFQFNPITTAWELMTLSFVIDWFWNVGRALNAISFLALTTKYTAATGVYGSTWREYERTLIAPKVNYSAGLDAKHIVKMDFKVRYPLSVPFTPFVDVNLNSFKVLDLLALMFQRLK